MDTISRLLERLSTEPNAPVQDPTPVQSNGNGNGGNGVHHHRRHPQLFNGDRLAAMRGYAGARFVIDYGVSIVDASRWTGSNPSYVAALLQIIAAGDAAFLRAVLRGHVPVLLAAEQAKKFNRLLKAYQAAAPATKAAFCERVGADKLFDELFVSEPTSFTVTNGGDKVTVSVEEMRS